MPIKASLKKEKYLLKPGNPFKTSTSLFSLPYTAHLVEFNKPHASKPPDPAVGFQAVYQIEN